MEAYIAGLIPSSSLHWPNKECVVVLFGGCDFHCPYCNVPYYLEFKDEFKVLLSDIKKQIKENSHFVNHVLFTGGEPCLQRQALLNLAGFSKNLGLKVGIETNGSRPEAIKSLLVSKAVDFIAMDLKSPLEPAIFEKVTKSRTFFSTTEGVISNIKESLRILKSADCEIEIRTTIVPALMYRKEDMLKIASYVGDLKCNWVFQQFDPSGEIVDKRFVELNSPTKEFMETLKRLCLAQHPNLRIEIKAQDYSRQERLA